MQKLAELCVRRPVFATMLIMTLVVLGMFSYSRLTIERFPRVEFPSITVITTLPGAAPQEVETEITDKIEEAVNTISGIDQLISISSGAAPARRVEMVTKGRSILGKRSTPRRP